MILEVRCCCNPQNLMGWLEVPDANVVEYSRFRLPLPRECKFGGLDQDIYYEPPETVTVHVRMYIPLFGERYLAINSHGTPLETWKRLKNFRPAKKDR